MKTQKMQSMIAFAVMASGTLALAAGERGGPARTYEITFTNLTQGAILTPPIFSVSRKQIDIFEIGEPASLGLELMAEGGMTDELRAELEAEGVQDVVQTDMPVMPGASITVTLDGDRYSRLNLASMLLPTNDGFVAVNGQRLWPGARTTTHYLKAHDAGTEINDETCATIPGPQCGGEGFNEADGEGYVTAHQGIHGEAELSRKTYGWGEPVAKVSIRVVRN